MKVVLLGAGASKSYSKSFSNVRMPIAKDFFQTFRKLSISENTWVLIGNIINYLKKYHHISTFEEFDKYNIDIEQIHTEIEQRLRDYLNDERETQEVHEGIRICFKAHTELISYLQVLLMKFKTGRFPGRI